MKRVLATLTLALGLSLAQGYASVEYASYGEYRALVTYDFTVWNWLVSPYVLAWYRHLDYGVEGGVDLSNSDFRLTVAWNSRYGSIYRLTWILRFGR